MVFKDFKEIVHSLLLGNVKVPDDKFLRRLVHSALVEVASNTKPLVLITSDVLFTPLKFLDERYFIRVPNFINCEKDEIDIDLDLIMAVAYISCSAIVVRLDEKSFFISKSREIINNFNWNKYEQDSE